MEVRCKILRLDMQPGAAWKARLECGHDARVQEDSDHTIRVGTLPCWQCAEFLKKSAGIIQEKK